MGHIHKQKGGYMTCDDCKNRNRCIERSRLYPCTSFKLREEREVRFYDRKELDRQRSREVN